MFHRLSKHLEFRQKILRCASYFQLSSWCLDIPMKHSFVFDMLLNLNVARPKAQKVMEPLNSRRKRYCEAIQWYWTDYNWKIFKGKNALKQRFGGQVVYQKAVTENKLKQSPLLGSHILQPWINREYNHIPVSRSHLCPKVNSQANENNVKEIPDYESPALYLLCYILTLSRVKTSNQY